MKKHSPQRWWRDRSFNGLDACHWATVPNRHDIAAVRALTLLVAGSL